MKRTLSLLLIITASSLMSGCALKNRLAAEQNATLNPVKIHESFPRDSDKAVVHAANEIPVHDYYAALALARTQYEGTTYKIADQALVMNYVREGVGLVNAYCSRWFGKLDDMSRMLAYNNKNVNVITQLTTALLGIGGASPAVVATYGASTTAFAGLSENFSSAFLLAPTASKVRDHIVAAMRTEEQRLAELSRTMTFKEAYTGLEAYAALCTHARAKEIVDKSLDLSNSTTDPTTGVLKTVSDPKK